MRAWGSPDKYIQGLNVLLDAGKYIKHLGNRFLIIIEPMFESSYGLLIEDSLKKRKKEVSTLKYSGEITERKLVELLNESSQVSPEVILVMGGGKLIDIGKYIANSLSAKLVICPSLASTDAPTSAMSIVYNDRSEFEKIILYSKNPDIVLVDSHLIGKSPLRFFIAGMGDALSTYFEGEANKKIGHNNYVLNGLYMFSGTLSGYAIAKECYNVIISKGVEAVNSLRQGIVDESVEDVIEGNTLLSGLGFENTGCSIAHAIGNAITVLDTGEKMLHGERVAFGVICQLLNDRVDLMIFEDVLKFMKSVGLPLTLEDMNISKEEVNLISEAALKEDSVKVSFEKLTKEKISTLILQANKVGEEYKNKEVLLP